MVAAKHSAYAWCTLKGKLPAALVAHLALAACTDGSGAPHTWFVVGQTSGGTYAVKLAYTTYGNALFGTYYFRNSGQPYGKAEGTIDGDAISRVLANSTSCTWDLVRQ